MAKKKSGWLPIVLEIDPAHVERLTREGVVMRREAYDWDLLPQTERRVLVLAGVTERARDV